MTKTNTAAARKPWVRPTVEKIVAGQAEAFTGTAGDGQLSRS